MSAPTKALNYVRIGRKPVLLVVGDALLVAETKYLLFGLKNSQIARGLQRWLPSNKEQACPKYHALGLSV
jgi:hypothetical protein